LAGRDGALPPPVPVPTLKVTGITVAALPFVGVKVIWAGYEPLVSVAALAVTDKVTGLVALIALRLPLSGVADSQVTSEPGVTDTAVALVVDRVRFWGAEI